MASGFVLRPDVVAEPLINGWYAWPMLVPPVHAALYTVNSHLKVMKSFVANPQLHAAALREPGMMGGPFMDLPPERVGDVRRHIQHTETEHAGVIRLAAAMKELEELLEKESDGTSLEPKYAKVPAPLRGYVELVYDINHRPSARLLERLLYRGPHYVTSWQSVRLARASDDRAFVFNTPRLEDGGSGGALSLRVPFAAPALDDLFRMRHAPGPLEPLEERLGLPAEQRAAFRSFFEPAEGRPAAPRAERWAGPGVRIRYVNHACVLVEGAGASVLCDPVIPYPGGTADGRVSYADLPERIDFVLLTHAHQDHFFFESLLQLRHRVGQVVVPRAAGGTLADPSLRLILEALGFPRVVELDALERLELPGGRITAMPFLGEHADLATAKSGYLVELEGKAVLFAADSNNLEPEVAELAREATRSLDALFIGMECEGGPMSFMYGGLLNRPVARKVDQSRRLNASDSRRALDLVERFAPREVYVYAMGLEPWLRFLTSIVYTDQSLPMVESSRFVAACRERGLKAERLSGPRQLVLA